MIDLHLHTNKSDGDFKPLEIIEEANKKGVSIISITDHNNITAYNEIKEIDLNKIYNGKIITGTELEFTKDGRLFDMLGYGFDIDKIKNTEIIKKGMIHSTIEGETKILNELKNICNNLSIKYSSNLEIKKANYMANDVLLDDIIKYPENKKILNNLGIIDRSTFYRLHFCEPSSPFYINKSEGKFDIFYVTKIIHDAGGKAFLAHPFVYKLPNLEEFLDEIISYDIIDGIECEHRKHNTEQIEWLKKYCNEHNLLKSGGSDKHKNNHYIGHSCNNQRIIQEDLVEDWINNIKPIYESSK